MLVLNGGAWVLSQVLCAWMLFRNIDLLAKSEADMDTCVNAISEPLETAIGALSSYTTDELSDCRNSSVAAFNLDFTSFVAARLPDTRFPHIDQGVGA
ncbi:hypothetical protein C8R48DRAFT_699853 [Suillus tomentosus]|nr:hypothetical protein C8R48DRAFT_699853 [Suillus tomentosus]